MPHDLLPTFIYVNERKLQFNNLKIPQLQISVTTKFNAHKTFNPFSAPIKKIRNSFVFVVVHNLHL
jgi:hypothetical protein